MLPSHRVRLGAEAGMRWTTDRTTDAQQLRPQMPAVKGRERGRSSPDWASDNRRVRGSTAAAPELFNNRLLEGDAVDADTSHRQHGGQRRRAARRRDGKEEVVEEEEVRQAQTKGREAQRQDDRRGTAARGQM
ncbi:MAG: hypothetical protein M1821_008299 [Bathelium mastoideum]|nr:MAG: hypothetical protein M1821_008299 [Bathelium mastoideum]